VADCKQDFRLLSNLPDKSHNQFHCANLFAYHFPRYSCLRLTILKCKTGSLHAKRQSVTLHAAKDNQLQQQEQKGGPEVDFYNAQDAGKSICMYCCDLCNEKSCMTSKAYAVPSKCIPKQNQKGEVKSQTSSLGCHHVYREA
jgi:hypothetical protein